MHRLYDKDITIIAPYPGKHLISEMCFIPNPIHTHNIMLRIVLRLPMTDRCYVLHAIKLDLFDSCVSSHSPHAFGWESHVRMLPLLLFFIE